MAIYGIIQKAHSGEMQKTQYFIAFLEGIITFISPCLLPMIPIYVSYFAGGGERTTTKTLKNALGFVLGFTTVFVLLGTLAGTLGGLLIKYRIAVNIITGLIVIFFGLNYLGVFKLNIFRGIGKNASTDNLGFFSSALFGVIFSVGWTPCVGAFLGSALMLASQQGHILAGAAMLLLYSLGLGIPFVVSAILIDKLKKTFSFIKKNYGIINKICGILLIVVGILMMTGLTGMLVNILS
jgi:cytochrome c-type biogenesis protein